MELHTEDGHILVGELAVPESGRDHRDADHAASRCPPTAVSWTPMCTARLPTGFPALAGVAVLRFNTRGTASPRGTSAGAFRRGHRRTAGRRGGRPFRRRTRTAQPLAGGVVVRHGAGADVRGDGAGGLRSGGRRPAVTPAAPCHGRAPAGVGGLGKAADGAGSRTRRLPPAGGRRRALQPGAAGTTLWASTAPSTFGWGRSTPPGCSTKSSTRSRRRVRAPTGLPQDWNGPVASAAP